MHFEDRIEIFYGRVLETWNDINTFVSKCDDFQKDWDFNFPAVETCKKYCRDAKREIEMVKSRLTNKTLKCVIIGKVSSGKSTLINSLLRHKVLPSGFSCRTNCFIEVKKSHNDRNYIMVGDEENSMESLKGLADDFSPDALSPGSRIELFYCADNHSLLNDDIVIIDTPGFDDISELDSSIEEICDDADVLILVVSSIVGLGETERMFIQHHKTIFSKLNLIILYSFWDKPQSENIDRSNKMKQRLLNQARQYLENDLHISASDCEDKIFFISAEEKLSSLSNTQESTDQFVQSRNEEFDKFLCCLKMYMSKNSITRRVAIVENISAIFDEIFKEIEFCMEEIKIKRVDCGCKLGDDLSIVDDLNNKINSEIEASFKEAYNSFFDKGLEIIRSGVAINDEDIKEKLNFILQELTVVTVESLKTRILDLVVVQDEERERHCIDILRSFYLPFYFNLEKELKSFDMEKVYKSFVEINRVKKIGTGLSIGGAVIGTAATLASGGILAGVILPIPTLLGASAFGVAGAAIGGGAGGGISNALISINREAFGYFYRNEEAIMKIWWTDMQNHIVDSYKLFLSELSTQVATIMTPLKEEFYSLPNKINFLRSEAHRMKNSH